jgi:hypothetical protein
VTELVARPLLDVSQRFGCQAITEVDLRERTHRNRPLHELRPHSRAVLDAVLSRALGREQPHTNGLESGLADVLFHDP